jgi:hypothetical protein
MADDRDGQAVLLLQDDAAGTKPTGRPTRRERTLSAAVATAVARTESARDQLAVRLKKRSKAASAKLVLQGRYMAAVRSLSKRAKAEVKTVRAEKGVEAAIALALSKRR